MICAFTWNSRGTGEESKNIYIRQNIRDQKLDFVGIQETVRQEYPTKFLKEISGGFEFHWDGIPSRGRSGGILVGVNKETYDVVDKQKGVYFVRFLIASKLDNFTWNLVVVYGDAQQDGKAKFLVELVNVIRSSAYPIWIAGDFNMTRKNSEKNKPGGYNRWSPLFNAVIEQGGPMEIKLSGRKFSWCNNHDDPPMSFWIESLFLHHGKKNSQ
jgi:hypothetical protein